MFYINKPWAIEKREFAKIVSMKMTPEKIEKAFAIRDKVRAEKPTKFQRTIKTYNEIYGGMSFDMPDDMPEMAEMSGEKTFCQIGSTAIIPVVGVIDRYDDIWTAMSGGVSVECLMDCFNAALTDTSIKTILFDVNSPGGSIDGPPELAEMIFRARGVKSTMAYVSRQGDSAAYWIASACETLVMHEAAEVGSIGVLMCYEVDAASETETKYIVSSNAGEKVADPETPEGAKILQTQIDKIEALFISAVAKHRATNEKDVKQNYGNGNVLLGAEAVAVGMADALGTFEDAIKFSMSRTGVNKMAGNKPQATATTAESGISIDTDLITAEWFEKNKPEEAAKLKDGGGDKPAPTAPEGEAPMDKPAPAEAFNNGIAHEAKRIADILAISDAFGAEGQSMKIKMAAIQKPGISALTVWNQIQTEARGEKVRAVADLLSDASAVAGIQSGKESQNTDADAERKHLLALGGKQINGGK